MASGKLDQHRTAKIAGHEVACSEHGVLIVDDVASVLPRGSHAALNFLPKEEKRQIVAWWSAVR